MTQTLGAGLGGQGFLEEARRSQLCAKQQEGHPGEEQEGFRSVSHVAGTVQ